ncbi:MAG: hypothetical protein Q9227_006490 [Pyrenula ochraceoflavens]
MIIGLVLETAFAFIPFFATSFGVLLAGLLLLGIPWGAFQVMTATYASEITSVELRPYLTTYVNLCWVIGQLLGSGVLRITSDRSDSWGYRIPLAVQWLWPAPLIVCCCLAPESPWWLVKQDRKADAVESLQRLTSRSDSAFDVDNYVLAIEHTNQIEESNSAGSRGLDCFKGINLRRTEICCMTWLIQALCGSTFMGYSTLFFQESGVPESSSFTTSIVMYAIGALGTFLSWYLMRKFGRRALYLYGCIALCVILLGVGFCGVVPGKNVAASWAAAVLIIIFTAVYDSTVGPVCYSLVSELSSTRLRAKTVALARIGYNVGSTLVSVLSNYQLTNKDKGGWDWSSKTGFFWGGVCFLCTLWIWERLPEPRGLDDRQLEILFQQHVHARNFSKAQVDPLSVHPCGDDPFRDNVGEASKHGTAVAKDFESEKVNSNSNESRVKNDDSSSSKIQVENMHVQCKASAV